MHVKQYVLSDWEANVSLGSYQHDIKTLSDVTYLLASLSLLTNYLYVAVVNLLIISEC